MKEARLPACISLAALFALVISMSPALIPSASATPFIVPHYAPQKRAVQVELEVESVTDMKDGTWSIVGRDSDGVKSSYTSGDNVTTLPEPGDLIELSVINRQVFSWHKLDKGERKQFRAERKDAEYRRTHKEEIKQKENIEIAVTLAVPGVILLLVGFLYLVFR